MPFYVYEVVREDGQPGERFEVQQSMNDPPLTEHPETGAPVRRVIQPPHVTGTSSLARADRTLKDDKKLGDLGFTKYVRAGDGTYEKRAGKGPDLISSD